jgi:hypothetical protein
MKIKERERERRNEISSILFVRLIRKKKRMSLIIIIIVAKFSDIINSLD